MQLRTGYANDPHPFVRLARQATDQDLAFVSGHRSNLAATLYWALVAADATRG